VTAQRAQVEGWLAAGLRLTKTYRRLAAQGVPIPYSSLHLAQRQLGFGAAATVRVVEPRPGEVAEVDFGLLGLWPDPTTGRRRRVFGFLVTLEVLRWLTRAGPAPARRARHS
jgi:hypothetical protein